MTRVLLPYLTLHISPSIASITPDLLLKLAELRPMDRTVKFTLSPICKALVSIGFGLLQVSQMYLLIVITFAAMCAVIFACNHFNGFINWYAFKCEVEELTRSVTVAK